MRSSRSASACACAVVALLTITSPRPLAAADIYVPDGGDLQAALNMAQPGDAILLAPGATYTGNFRLPAHAGTSYITIRTAAARTMPASGSRVSPGYAGYMAKLKSMTSAPALATNPGAAFWRLLFVEIAPGPNASGDMVDLGDGSSAQTDLAQVPHHLILDRVYVHGDPLNGQKRGIGLNSASTTIINSYISGIRAVGADAQALAGWNGPGPYRIENNYLEGAGTTVLFGGDDPKIPNLIPSDITFTGNTVTRPVSWRNPILATPDGALASFAPGGSLPAGTYAYRIVARRAIGSTMVKSAASAEVAVTVPGGSRAIVQWNPVADATEYLVYGRSPDSENHYWRVTETTFTDDGISASASGTAPSAGTAWQVKNLFELKNARRAQIDHNVIENNWAQAQSGTAILFTPRNQYGSCTWCVVEDVTFEYNVVRSIAGGIQVMGWDNLHPSQQANNIRIRNNVVSDLSKSWGSNAYFLYITAGPRDLTVDHNTIISPNGSGIVIADGAPISNFVYTNNLARHNAYGIFGSGYSIGNGTIAYYFPASLITRNVFAGGKASSYPAGNEFPTTTDFEAHFEDYAGGDYRLVPNTGWQASGTDGLDLGANIAMISTVRALTAADPPLIGTASLADGTDGLSYSATLQATGGVAPYQWSLASGVLPQGIALDATGAITGTPFVTGEYSIVVQVQDASGATANQPLALRIVPRVEVTTGALNGATATLPFAQTFEATGGLGTYLWALGSGTLPPGITLSADGLLSGTPTVRGTYDFSVTAADATNPARVGVRAFSLTVAKPPNVVPTVSLTSAAAGTTVPAGSPVVLTISAADVDGTVARVDLYQGTTLIGSGAGASLTVSWVAPASGTYQVAAMAVDDEGGAATSLPVNITANGEVVLYARDVTHVVGNYQLSSDATAAAGVVLWNPDRGAAKNAIALASPASYAEFTFYAEAGRQYHLWIRGRGQKDSWANDSAFVQFSGVSDARIGTSSSYTYSVEPATNAGISGWGWEDNGWGAGVLGVSVVFDQTGRQTLRIQPREDGLSIDQIVLSPQQYLTASPGVLKNDTTILPQ